MTALLRLTRHSRPYSSALELSRRVNHQLARPRSSAPPHWIEPLVGVVVTSRHGWRCYELTPRRPPVVAARRVVYWHGGAYVFEISPFHWLAAAKIVAASRVPLVLPIYPLAPLSTAGATVGTATRIVADLAEGLGADSVTLMGDSAGGGLALAAAQRLRSQHNTRLRAIILISPWLDVTMTDPGSAAIAPHDAMLRRPGLVEAGRLYAGELDVRDPLVSPLHGGVQGLAPLTVFSGTHDLVHPDSRRLEAVAAEAGVRIDHEVLVGGQHCFPLHPIREGGAALRRIARLV